MSLNRRRSRSGIRNLVGRAECDADGRSDGLTTAEREELNQLRRETQWLAKVTLKARSVSRHPC